MTAGNPNIPLEPPREWFTPPTTMTKDAGCIVEPNGRIYGYLCHWNTVLMDGKTDRWTPPKSRSNYAYAHTGDTLCDDGTLIKTANLGGDAGHAKADPYDPEKLNKLQDFYENTQTQLARVCYGEDENGVWFAGACWPTVTDLDIAKLRASARSGHWTAIGDWRDIQSGRQGYELVGACLVNVPGLKYARADRAASGILTLRPMNATPTTLEDIARQLGEIMTTLPTIVDPAQVPVERVAASGTIALAAEDAASPVKGVLVVENQVTEDGRFIESGALDWRELPLPLYAKLENTMGHDDAQLVGKIETITRDEGDPNTVLYTGTIRPEAADGYGQKVLDAIANEELRGVSIDGIAGPDDGYVDENDIWHMTKLTIGGATLTPMPAIGQATVTIGLTTKGDGMEEDLAPGDAPAADTPAPEDTSNAATPASADAVAAVSDKLDAVADQVAQVLELVTASQMSARLSALAAREAALDARESALGESK